MHFLKSFVVFVLSESPKSLRNPLLESSEVKPFRNLLNESSEPKILPEIPSGLNPRFRKSSDGKSPESSVQIPLHMKRPTPPEMEFSDRVGIKNAHVYLLTPSELRAGV